MVNERYPRLRSTLFMALGLTVGHACGPSQGDESPEPTQPAPSASPAPTPQPPGGSQTPTLPPSGGSQTPTPPPPAGSQTPTPPPPAGSQTPTLPPSSAACSPITGPGGSPSGYASCPDGTLQKTGPSWCDPSYTVAACEGTEEELRCTSDVDCTAGPNGQCASESIYYGGGEPEVTTCSCIYTCSNDDECGAGNVCICSGLTSSATGKPYSVCAPAGCVTGADCPSGECGVSEWSDGCDQGVLTACRTGADECRTHADCTSSGANWCAAQSTNATTWSCVEETCFIGRLLLNDGEAQCAPSRERADWAQSHAAPLGDQSPELRAHIARRWEEIAALEHASVASFARTTLSLMALGAPPELLHDTQRAASDEVEHARITYGLASTYAGRSIGPGPLPVGELAIATDRREAITAVIAEACVGETLGASEAHAMAHNAHTPELRAALERIATDEERHAALAWRTLSWLMGQDPQLKKLAHSRLEQRIHQTVNAIPGVLPCPGHGLLSAAEIRRTRRQTTTHVLQPLMEALFAVAPEA